MDLTRFVPQRYWRNALMLLLGLLTFAILSIVLLIVWELWTFHPLPPDQFNDLPAWARVLLPIVQRDLRIFTIVAFIVGISFVCLALFLAINFIRADKVKIWGVEYQVSDELTLTRKELETQFELVAALQENIREIQDLVEQQSLLILNPDVNQYFEYLDKIVETSAFIIRSQTRSVHASIWLYNKRTDEMRMVAGYRIGQRSLRNFKMKIKDDGFAPFVLRSQSPQERTSPSVGHDWKLDPDNATATTSILGQPIQVGQNDEWQAVLCFSSDRDINKFPEYKFSIDKDAATLRFFSGVISFALGLARGIEAQKAGGTTKQPLIEVVFERYI